MNWLNFLHFYQPANQQPDVLEAVVAQSYRPIFEGISKLNTVSVTANVTGCLVELFDKYGYTDIIDLMKRSLQEGKLELTGSAKYHSFLPLIPLEESYRQVKQNDETLRFYFGDAYKPRGFFPPEMGYDPKIIPLLKEFNYDWIILDEIAYSGGHNEIDYNKIYKLKDTNIKAFFRNRRASNLIMSAVVRSKESLLSAFKDDIATKSYLVTGMDGETFGHHRPGLEGLLFEVFDASEFDTLSISKFLDKNVSKLPEEIVELRSSTWASSPQDIAEGIQFLSWLDKTNIIHAWQWELLNLALSLVHKMSENDANFADIRKKMDIAMGSDHFWWASAKPWWSLEMIEDGAYRLLDIIRTSGKASVEELNTAVNLYQRIISTAFDWQRTGKIRQMARQQGDITRIPFKDRTLGKGGSEQGVYWAFVDMMKRLEKEAAEKGEYEKAILWRDALFKLDKKLDIYETIHAIDLLRQEIPHDEVERTLDKYTEPYKQMRGGQPEQRGR